MTRPTTQPPEPSTHTPLPPDLADRPATAAMSRPVIVVSATATLTEALGLLTAARVRHLVLVGDDLRCQGVIVDRALASEWARDPAGFGDRTVGEIVDRVAPTVPVNASVADAAKAMQRYQLDAVVVVEARGMALGIITATDLIALLAAGKR